VNSETKTVKTKLKELVKANKRLDGMVPKELGQLASLEIFQHH
jgi:hypothetical protein